MKWKKGRFGTKLSLLGWLILILYTFLVFVPGIAKQVKGDFSNDNLLLYAAFVGFICAVMIIAGVEIDKYKSK